MFPARGTVGRIKAARFDWHDVRLMGAGQGCYSLADRRESPEAKIDVYACRLCSISTRIAVVLGPVAGRRHETVAAHFEGFGLLRGKVARGLPSGFVMELRLTPEERDKLGQKIAWRKRAAIEQLPDQREHKRILPREPRTLITLADGTLVPCFVIDVSQSGVAVSAPMRPALGTPMAVGKVIGRVVRYLEMGFALQFVQLQAFDQLEAIIAPPEVQPMLLKEAV
jgi:hypothetical protein